jgi:hypothetical protein
MDEVRKQLEIIAHMDLCQLRQKWRILYCSKAAPTMSKKLMRLAVAFRSQEIKHKTTPRCDAIRAKANTTPTMPQESKRGYAQHLQPGTKLLREYDGKIHEVLVIEDGCFVYRGQVSTSLTEVARRISGKHTSGTNFFGLLYKKRVNKIG